MSRTHDERVRLAARAVKLRQAGLTARQIADELGVSRSYAAALYSDPDGSKDRVRRERYYNTCPRCGGRMGSRELWGDEKAPETCISCSRQLAHKARKWTRESVIDAIRRFAAVNGRPPLSEEWIFADPDHAYPSRSAVYGKPRGSWQPPFEKWADAIEAAGFPRPRQGMYVRRPRAPRKTKRPHVYTTEGRKEVRDYIILELGEDGSWIQHENVQSYSEALAIEKFVEGLGSVNGRATHKFVAVSAARWVVRELKPVTTFKAVAAG